jgi:hypothetical protein
MVLAIVLSLAAGFCTATSPVCQRLGARSLDAREPGVTGFDLMLVSRLARRPAWPLGFGSLAFLTRCLGVAAGHGAPRRAARRRGRRGGAQPQRPDQLASCGGGVGHATPGPFTNGIDEEVAVIGGG